MSRTAYRRRAAPLLLIAAGVLLVRRVRSRIAYRRRAAPLLLIIAGVLLVSGCGPQVKGPPSAVESPQLLPLETLPTVNPQQAALGRVLFFDPRLSGDGQRSCADCHRPERGWSGDGETSWRVAPGLLPVAHYRAWNADGSATSLEQQIAHHAHDALVLNSHDPLLEARLALLPGYRELFSAAFGTSSRPSAAQSWEALAAFSRSLARADSPLDRYLRGERSALDRQQVQGMQLFQGKAGCSRCHHGPLLSDQRYHVTAVPTAELWRLEAEEQIRYRYRLRRAGVANAALPSTRSDPGRWLVSGRETERGAFRTPSLRELTHTAPYMRNGAFTTLEQVIAFYDRGGSDPDGRPSLHLERRSQLLRPLGLSAAEQQALVAFLHTSSGPPVRSSPPQLPQAPAAAPPREPPPPAVEQRSVRELLAPPPWLQQE